MAKTVVLTCKRCGFDWNHPYRRGRYPIHCRDCSPKTARPDKVSIEAYLKLLDHVNVRLAVEEATSLLRMGRFRQALARLEQVPARARSIEYDQRRKAS